MSDETKNLRIVVSADTSEFKRAMKEASDLPKKMKTATGGGKVQKALNADSKQQGKAALKQEKALQDLMKDQLSILKAQTKLREKDLTLIKKTREELRRTNALHGSTQAGRRGTGVRTGRESWGAVGGNVAGGLGRMAGGALMGLGGIVAGVVGKALAAVVSDISQGHGNYMAFGQSAGRLSGTGFSSANMFKKGTKKTIAGDQDYYTLQGMDRSTQLGYSASATLGHMSSVARAAGGGANLLSRTQDAQNVSRQYGGDVSEVVGFMGTLTQASGDKGSEAGRKREFQRTMFHAIHSGMDASRAGEAMQAMGGMISSVASSSGGKVNSGAITALMAQMGQSGNPALQGARGAGILGSIHSSITGMGQISSNGEANKAAMYHALGMGTGDKGTDYISLVRKTQRGIGDIDNLRAFISAAEMEGGGDSDRTDYALSAMTGGAVTMDQAGAMRAAVDDPEELARLMAAALPVDKQIADSNLEISKYTAGLENRLIEIGRSSDKSMRELQMLRNEIVDALMPLALKAFDAIVQTLGWIWDGIQELIALAPGQDDKQNHAAFLAMKKEHKEIDENPAYDAADRSREHARVDRGLARMGAAASARSSMSKAWGDFTHGQQRTGFIHRGAVESEGGAAGRRMNHRNAYLLDHPNDVLNADLYANRNNALDDIRAATNPTGRLADAARRGGGTEADYQKRQNAYRLNQWNGMSQTSQQSFNSTLQSAELALILGELGVTFAELGPIVEDAMKEAAKAITGDDHLRPRGHEELRSTRSSLREIASAAKVTPVVN